MKESKKGMARISLNERIVCALPIAAARLFTLAIAPAFFSTGKGCLIVPPLKCGNLKLVRLCANVTIHDHCWFLTRANPEQENQPKVIIGNGTTIGSFCTISAAKSVIIGENVLFGGHVFISDHGHAYEDITRPVQDQGIKNIRQISIGDGSWIGQNAVILSGSVIGRHCVIGANAVVKSVVPDYTVAAGNPARIIKRYHQETGIWEKEQEI